MNNKTTKQILFLISFGVILYVGLTHMDVVFSFVGNVGKVLLPVLLGCILAFILNVPVKGFEKLLARLCAKMKKKPSERTLTCVGLLLSLLCIAAVVALFCTMMVPELASSIKSIYKLVEAKWPIWIEQLSRSEFDMSIVIDWMKNIDIQNLIRTATGSIGSVVSSVVNIAASSVSVLTTACFGIVIAFYILVDKKNLSRQAKKLLSANFTEKKLERFYFVCNITSDTYSRFLSGQCVEAVVLGCLIYLAFLVFRLPYAGLIGVSTAVFALIPYIGALASCVLAVLLTLLSSPTKVLICVIVYLVVQFVETQFIYPHVVGSSVGLSPLWTLVAALVGGNLFGLPGILFFIPLTAVIITLLREDTEQKLERQGKAVSANGAKRPPDTPSEST